MSLEILVNSNYYFFQNVRFYQDTVTINCSLECNDENNKNSIVLWAVDPRTNISNVMYISNLSFDPSISNDENCFGLLETELFLCYHRSNIVQTPMEVTTAGKKILQFVIYFPKEDRTFLREIKLYSKPRFKKFCFICYEEKDNNVYVDTHHHFCMDCILKLNCNLCPICRKPILQQD